jgi:hypothetical protein
VPATTPPGVEPEAVHDPDGWQARLRAALLAGEPGAVDRALAFLEADPFFFRSGYTREKVARTLARTAMAAGERERARALVRAWLAGDVHTPEPGITRLAAAVADGPLRRAVRAALHDPDGRIARRALAASLAVRRPGFGAGDLAAARAIVVEDAGRHPWLAPSVARAARRLWDRGWEAELRDLARRHGEARAGARRLLAEADRRAAARTRRRGGGRPGP